MHSYRSFIALLSLASFVQISAQGINVGFNVQDDVCDSGNGCIEAFVTGGTAPYTFLWEPNPPNGQGTPNCCGLVSGIYTLTVTDGNGVTQTAQAPVSSTTGLNFDTSPGIATTCTDPCSGYWSRSGNLGGVAPYTVTVDPPAGSAIAAANGVEVFGLCEGTTYSIAIEDANGCSAVINDLTVSSGGPPQVLFTNQQGICQGFPQGNVEVTFDQVISQVTVISGTATVNVSGNTVYLVGLGIGTNIFNAISTPICTNVFVIEVEDDTENCGTIEGVIRADIDANCIANPTDPPVPFRMLRVQPGNYLAMTNGAGVFSKGAPYGAHTIASEVIGMGTDCMAQHPMPFDLSVGSPTATVDFLLTPQTGPDAAAFIGAGWFRPGFATTITASVRNNNAFEISDVSLAVDYDPLLLFGAASQPPSVSFPGHAEWVLPTLQPYETIYRNLVVTTPNDVGLIGTNLIMSASLSMPTADADAGNDVYGITRTIIGSYDPNDMLVRTSSNLSGTNYFNDVDEHIDYTIRFQNTGTAEAVDVYILDTISPLLDLASFELLGASHSMIPSVDDERVLRFHFPNILLPDSNTNEPASHGFVSFRMKPEGTLEVYEEITNAADIYFDFNAPVRTNTTVLTVDYTVGIAEQRKTDLRLAPNPVDGSLQIISPFIGSIAVDVFDMEGRSVLMRSMTGTVNEMDVSALAPGVYVLRVMDQQGVPMQARFVKR